MNAKEKRLQKQKEIIEEKKVEVIRVALSLFLKQGIDNTKMTEIANRAKIGIASLYRYFPTKPLIVVETASLLWSERAKASQVYRLAHEIQTFDGFQQMEIILQSYLDLYQNHQDFLRFLDEFDQYIIKEKIPISQLLEYDSKIQDLKAIFYHAIEKGQKDGSIRKDLNKEEYYYTTTHSLTALSQKLIIRGDVLKSDTLVLGEQQVQLMIDMSIRYLK